MRYIHTHIQAIIASYTGLLPLTHFLKQYFRQHPKLGSRDRKILSDMTYCWYRCSKGITGTDNFEDMLSACLYLCDTTTPHITNFLPAVYVATKQAGLEEKIMLLNDRGIRFNPEAIAPFDLALSTGITTDEWRLSMLHQPDLFIRIRRDKERILQILTEQGIRSQLINETCLALPNGSPIDKLLPENSYVVQDASSQQTGSFFSARPNESWWDCCSGAGGKSLLLKDKQPKIRLSVSDKRASILHNLEKRFQLYGLEKPVSYVADISDERSLKDNIVNAKFDNIICDVPCTGSGTWSRTPEQMFFFNREDALTLSKLQATIAINAEQRLKPGGSLYYITCSVFEQENENVVQEVVEQTGLQLADKQLINGIEQKADSMFIAVLKKD